MKLKKKKKRELINVMCLTPLNRVLQYKDTRSPQPIRIISVSFYKEIYTSPQYEAKKRENLLMVMCLTPLNRVLQYEDMRSPQPIHVISVSFLKKKNVSMPVLGP